MCLGTRVPLKVVELSNTSFQAQSQCGVLQLMAQLGRPRPTSSHTSKSIVYRFVTIESPCRPGCEPTRVDCAVGKSQDISRLSREYASGAELAQGMWLHSRLQPFKLLQRGSATRLQVHHQRKFWMEEQYLPTTSIKVGDGRYLSVGWLQSRTRGLVLR